MEAESEEAVLSESSESDETWDLSDSEDLL
jgi:hypothetical protein